MRLEGWQLLIILAIVLLLFGAPRLPALARSIGQSMKIFRTEIKEPKADDQTSTTVTSDAAPSNSSAPTNSSAPSNSSGNTSPTSAASTPTGNEAASGRTS